jgi:hypothetical protein
MRGRGPPREEEAMKRFRRKTNPSVVAGQVRKKNRTDRSPRYDTTPWDEPAVHRLKPGFGYRHILRQKDVVEFVRLLPEWEELSRGLNAITLAPGRWNCDGWYRPGVVAVCAWNRALRTEISAPWYAEHKELFERLEVPCEQTAEGWYLCWFTEPAIRAYQLLHILLHELGHHHDRMTTRSLAFAPRGEGYAEAYAWKHEQEVWDRYLSTFGLY